MYVKNSNFLSKIAREKIRNLIKEKSTNQSAIFFFGTSFGIGMSLIIVIITALNLENINLENDELFKRDFPVWRGMCFFIMYIWMIGFNAYLF